MNIPRNIQLTDDQRKELQYRYDERISILSDGNTINDSMKAIAQHEVDLVIKQIEKQRMIQEATSEIEQRMHKLQQKVNISNRE